MPTWPPWFFTFPYQHRTSKWCQNYEGHRFFVSKNGYKTRADGYLFNRTRHTRHEEGNTVHRPFFAGPHAGMTRYFPLKIFLEAHIKYCIIYVSIFTLCVLEKKTCIGLLPVRIRQQNRRRCPHHATVPAHCWNKQTRDQGVRQEPQKQTQARL
jgi:hypothetical protein